MDVRPNIEKLDTRTYSATEEPDVLADVWRMLNFYLSVYRQAKSGGLSRDFENAFGEDFCLFIGAQARSEAWDKLISSGKISKWHGKMREDWCDKK